MATDKTGIQAFILRTKAGQWKYEIWADEEELSGGAGYADQGEAIEAALENNAHLEGLKLVIQQDSGQNKK